MSTQYIRTFNAIDPVGLAEFSEQDYQIISAESDVATIDAIICRSHKLTSRDVTETVKVVARAGAGTNNIPVAELTNRGIPVLNTPGANANAVKELVIAAMLLAARNILPAWQYLNSLKTDEASWSQTIEAAKKQFRGSELPGKTLGVVGLGAIGVKVANAAKSLGMQVMGYDPAITVQRAWELSSEVNFTDSLEQLLKTADFVSIHVPLAEDTRNLFAAEHFAMLQQHAILLNFSRAEVVDESALLHALDQGQMKAYLTDFPSQQLCGHEKVIAFPHLGASTTEAETQCAVMATRQVKNFLETGEIVHSVNFPAISLPRTDGYRLVIINVNVPNMVAQMSTILAEAKLNIIDLLNKSRGDVAISLVDVDKPVADNALTKIRQIKGVLSVRGIK